MQDRPTAPELLLAIAAFLEDDIQPQLSGRPQFHTRVAVNLLRILEREWRLGPEHDAADRAALADLGDDSPTGLADQIRSGALDGRHEDVLEALRGIARRKLEVAKPDYITGPHQASSG